MSDSTSKPMDAEVYQAIEAALLTNERGRLFLAEHARRQRASGTVTLLDAICRLEDVIREDRGGARLCEELEEMRSVLGGVRQEIAAALRALGPAGPAEQMRKAMRLLRALELRLAAMVEYWSMTAPPTEKPDDRPSAAAAADLLRRLQTMTPEERLKLFHREPRNFSPGGAAQNGAAPLQREAL